MTPNWLDCLQRGIL